MLNEIRRYRNSVGAKVVLIAIAASFFIGFGVLSSVQDDSSATASIVARVEGEPIYRRDLAVAMNNMIEGYKQQFGGQIDQAMLDRLPIEQLALENLVQREVLLAEAAKAGIRVSDQEVRDYILSIEAFRNANGQFDPDIYKRALMGAGTGLTPTIFEQEVRESLTIDRLRQMIESSVLVTDEQLRELFIARNDKANLAFVGVSADDVRKDVKLTDADLGEYYETHKSEYALPERRTFSYAVFSPAKFAQTQTVSDAELQAAYEARRDEFQQDEEVRASHILFKVEGDDEAAWEDARKKAEGIAEQARSGADFAELARKNSQDGSASSGGDLGFFGRGRMVKPFEDAAFSLPKNDVSAPVRSQFGWHVIKVTDRREAGVKPLEQVRAVLESELKQQKGAKAFEEAQSDIADRLAKGEDLTAVAEAYGIQVQKTGQLNRNGRFPGVLEGQKVLEAGFGLESGKSSKLIDAGATKVAVRVDAVEPARDRALNEVRADVEKALRDERADVVAASRAADILDAAREKGSLKAATRLTVQETGAFNRLGGEVPEIGQDADLLTAAFRLTPANPLPDRLFKVDGTYYVVALKDRSAPDMKQFDQEREGLTNELLSSKREAVFTSWIQTARNRAKVETFITPQQPAAAQGQGFPLGG